MAGVTPAGPVADLIDRMHDPAVALIAPDMPADRGSGEHSPEARRQAIAELARQMRAASDWTGLAQLYQHLSDQAWKAGRPALSLRLLLAERCFALRAGDHVRQAENAYYLTERHRLSESFIAAETWSRTLLNGQLAADTARFHARAWRELATIAVVKGDEYDEGLRYCDRALALCEEFADAPGMTIARIQALLEKTQIERLRGHYADAFAFVRQAHRLASEASADRLTTGLIMLRRGGLELSTGRFAEALRSYQDAAAHFLDVSSQNFSIARLSQVACLRALRRQEQALYLTSRLAEQFRSDGDRHRLGQVLLERAEVLDDIGDKAGVSQVLAEARPFFEHNDTLESLRWHRHLARNLIKSGDVGEALEHLRIVLKIASQPGRRDLTRTMLALQDMLRLPEIPAVPADLWFAICRATLIAADSQRASLAEPETRWALRAEREGIYSSAVLLHAEAGDGSAVAQIAEVGRADLLNELLSAEARHVPGTLTHVPIVPSPPSSELVDGVFELASVVSEAVRAGRYDAGARLLPLPGEVPSPADMDQLAEITVIIELGNGPKGWWSSVTTRLRGASWNVTVRYATPTVSALISKLTSGEPLPPRGMSARQWEALGEFLLPAQEIWDGGSASPRSMLICPDPRLWNLPHAALPRDGVHLADIADVTLTPSLRTAHLLRRRAANWAGDPARGAGPVVSLLDPALPGHPVELAALDAWPGGHYRMNDLSQLAEAGHAELLYVSGHAEQPGADATLGPGAIKLDSLASCPLPRLVILNGCWSGTAASRYGQDPLSLAVGGLLGGAQTVIAGIGRLGSVASAHVAALTVEMIQQGLPAPAALRRAQCHVRASHPELGPLEWAGLCAVGVGP